MDWEKLKFWLFREKRFSVSIILTNGKVIDKFIAKRMSQGPKNRLYKMEDGRTIKVSNELACVTKQVWLYDDKIIED